MPVQADLDKVLDKAYENWELAALLKAPVAALAGVSEGDAEKLKAAFGIDTVEELGRHRLFRVAAALVDLADRA
jgi:hypothetical protein